MSIQSEVASYRRLVVKLQAEHKEIMKNEKYPFYIGRTLDSNGELTDVPLLPESAMDGETISYIIEEMKKWIKSKDEKKFNLVSREKK